MGENIEMKNGKLTTKNIDVVSDSNLIISTEELLSDARTKITSKTSLSMPIAQLSTLGAGVSSLLPALRTVTQTTTFNTQGYYRVANAAIGDTLKAAKNGNFWGAIKSAEGASKMAQFQEAGFLKATTHTMSAINPATMMMAVALFSIEQQLGNIAEMEKQIISFLEIEKESEVEADIQTLGSIINQYKLNWDNDLYVASHHQTAIDIQRTARKNMNSYQKQVAEMLGTKKLFVAQSKVNSTLQDLLKKFKNYRLSLYTFSMASLIEVMLGGNFNEEYISGIKSEIESMSKEYRKLYTLCSAHLEKLTGASVQKNVLKGLGVATDEVGKFLGKIPVVEKGRVDEFLHDSGIHMRQSADGMETKIIAAFADVKDPATRVFLEKMQDMIQIYNHTSQICFDEKNIYLIAEN